MAGGQGEAAGFAALLRELKERSGHSYGFLAKRCHLGTSTLHRYCHGVAVPGDYAPVERLARLCGATTDELAELHRRWLVAHAAKTAATAAAAALRNPPPPEEPTAEGPAAPGPDEPEPTPGPAPASGTAPAPGTGPGAAPPAKPAPAQAETVPSDGPVPEEGRPSTGVPAGAPGWPPGGVSAPVAGPTGAASVTRAARVRGALRRRPVPVAVAVALAVLMAAVLVAVGRGVEPGGSEQAAPGASADPGPEPGPKGGGPSGAMEPDGRGASAEPSDGGATDSGAPEPSPSGAGDRGARQDGGTAQGPGSPVPLTITTRSHVWQAHCDHRYLVDPGVTGPEDVPAPPVEQDAPAWAGKLDAVHAGRTNVEVTVQGVGDTAVVLQDLHVRMVERRTPLPWTSYAMEHGCGGALTPARFTVNLDAERPVAVPEDGLLIEGGSTEHVLPVPRMPFRVSAGEPQVLRIEASAVRCDCDWYLELAWSAGGRSGTLRIDDNGRPFRTSGAEGRPELFHWPEKGWRPLEG